MQYWITYHDSKYDHTRREYGITNNPMDIFRKYYEILQNHKVLSVDIDNLENKGIAWKMIDMKLKK